MEICGRKETSRTYGTSENYNFVDCSGGFGLEKLVKNRTTDVADASNSEVLEARHDVEDVR